MATSSPTRKRQPSRVDDETYDAILERIASGELVTDVVADYALTRADVWRASEERENGHTSLGSPSTYMRARIAQAHSIAEDTLLIADGRDVDGRARMRAIVDSMDGVDNDDKARLLASLQANAVQRDTLRVNTRKFLLAKIAPRIYGEHTTTEVSGTIQHEHTDVTALQATLGARLAGIASRRKLLTAQLVDAEIVEDTASESDA